jgi:NTP pyrophosphatase (non-canonical NTP hydrolase)
MIEDQTKFVEQFHALQRQVYNTASQHGFWDDPVVNHERTLLLIIREATEAVEALRKPEMEADKHIPEFTELEAELADVVLRSMNYAQGAGLRLVEAMLAKAAYNDTRPHRHGGKKF